MFVAEVTEQTGRFSVKSGGFVRSQKSINNLLAKGVSKVLVDLDKSEHEKEPEVAPVSTAVPVEKVRPKTSFKDEIGKAKKLYNQAKTLQRQALKNMKAGRPIDTGGMKEVADGFIDSIFRNQDALACMTRMRQKDDYLMEHSINVSIIMTIFAKHLQIDEKTIHDLATGALLHDLGKINIPDEVLHKPGRLTDDEMVIMRSHVTLGYDILRESSDLSPTILEVVRDHHERLDGSGYPNGKNENELSQFAKMISICDTYDAITASRVYQNARTPIMAFKILRKESGTGFDANLVAEFINCMGVHPVGTLIQTKSNKLGIVIKSNFVNPLCPVVKVFYSLANKGYIPSKTIDLGAPGVEDEIAQSVKPEDYGIDINRIMTEILD
ncbi:HD-GYP domain-containing protein [Psychrosphaera aestuarii]|uniref:HD-GYP domain-containing protein n=1 Tax=Psychrosphaera aestuarii TaxID=1266052 RepID=UPI001FD262DC|nr:HD-GYP domain-containing protein [Psychrosphaera aestuarii]